jgi:hypothetical protein
MSPNYYPRAGRTLPHLDYLIQTPAYIGEGHSRQSLERMRPCPAHTPIERCWLVAKYVTGFPRLASTFGLPDSNGKGVVSIIFRCGHGQADNKTGVE